MKIAASFWMAIATGCAAATLPATDSIRRAIALAGAGDTIMIQGPRVFRERVVVDKPLRLVGVRSPVIDAGGSGTALTIRATNVLVRGLTLRHAGHNLANFDSGIMIAAPDATVEHCRVEVGGFGIYLHGVAHCRIEDNVVIGDTHLPSAARGNGIHLWNANTNDIVGNFVSQTRDGAYFSFADGNLIASNHVEHTRFGIHYMYSNGNRLIGNELTANSVGAALMFSRNCDVTGNHAFANLRHGILLKQIERSRFAGNCVRGQNRGFDVLQAAQNRFEGNEIAQNDIGLYLSNESEDNVFIGNAFVDNTRQVWLPPDEFKAGLRGSNRFSERGRGNFWSDYTGTDANGDGIGDTPYHQTDTFGYLVDRHPEARVFAFSPAAALLRRGEELLPLLNVGGVTDPAPLMKVPGSKFQGSRKTQLSNLKRGSTRNHLKFGVWCFLGTWNLELGTLP